MENFRIKINTGKEILEILRDNTAYAFLKWIKIEETKTRLWNEVK